MMTTMMNRDYSLNSKSHRSALLRKHYEQSFVFMHSSKDKQERYHRVETDASTLVV